MDNSKVRSLVVIVAAVVGAVAGSAAVQGLFRGNAEGSASIDATLAKASHELNKTLPTMVDRDTRLDSTFAGPDHSLIYRYTLVNHSREELNPEQLREALRPTLVNNYRTTESMKTLRDAGVRLVYQYSDKSGVSVMEISVSPKDF